MYACGTDRRRELVRAARVVNGIDFLEVSADQLELRVRFVLPLPGGGPGAVPSGPGRELTRRNVLIRGGVRRPDPRVVAVSAAADLLTVRVDRPGDFDTYTLLLRGADPDHPDDPPAGFDPCLSEVAFSFKAGCDNPFDCPPPATEPPPPGPPEPEIDYLARDYPSVRRLMLDRLCVTLPGWTERNPADAQVTLVEALAYLADRISYQQDAVGTEAYLATARHRPSVRRHTRLLDYRMHDGANARAFLHLRVAGDVELPPPGDAPANAAALAADTRFLAGAPDDRLVFRALAGVRLRAAHRRIVPHRWGEDEYTLPAGATSAALPAAGLDLRPGDLLLWEEERGTADADQPADPARRQVVRLTGVRAVRDPVTAVDVLLVSWDGADALRLPLRVAVRIPALVGPLVEVAVARGNIVPVDHGDPVRDEPPLPAQVPDHGRYRPALAQAPVTFAAPYDPRQPAAQALLSDPRSALPEITLRGAGLVWQRRADLLAGDGAEPAFVAEVDTGGRVRLRFGDGEHGRAAAPGDRYRADYRVGGGTAGNLPAEMITGIDPPDPRVAAVRNPLPAAGGVDGEPVELVRLVAPYAFRRQERAVTAADYAEMTQRHPEVQRAVAELRWTGSWHTVFVAIDRLGGADVTPAFAARIRDHLERYRRAGHDIEVRGPVWVSLALALDVCCRPEFRPEDVQAALTDALAAVFHPDRLTFGGAVYLSAVHQAALAVPGVDSVAATAFHRWGRPPGTAVPPVLVPGPLEIFRLANDPNFPEHGRIELTVGGGR